MSASSATAFRDQRAGDVLVDRGAGEQVGKALDKRGVIIGGSQVGRLRGNCGQAPTTHAKTASGSTMRRTTGIRDSRCMWSAQAHTLITIHQGAAKMLVGCTSTEAARHNAPITVHRVRRFGS